MLLEKDAPPTFVGVVKGNTVVLDGYDMSGYEGDSVVVTIRRSSGEAAKRMKAYNNLLEFAGTVPKDIDIESEIEAALWEKYDSID